MAGDANESATSKVIDEDHETTTLLQTRVLSRVLSCWRPVLHQAAVLPVVTRWTKDFIPKSVASSPPSVGFPSGREIVLVLDLDLPKKKKLTNRHDATLPSRIVLFSDRFFILLWGSCSAKGGDSPLQLPK